MEPITTPIDIHYWGGRAMSITRKETLTDGTPGIREHSSCGEKVRLSIYALSKRG
jgi:hypothetical protein